MDISSTLSHALSQSPIIPVLVVDEMAQAAPLAKALEQAGYTILEVTFRTPIAADVILEMKKQCPQLVIGAGTILTTDHVKSALAAGSDFLVTPAMSPNLKAALQDIDIAVYPGAATLSEALTLLEYGFTKVKFFPAEASGGIEALKSFAQPLPHISFMPTGGIDEEKARAYLSLANVFAVGGTWMIDKAALKNHDWDGLCAYAENSMKVLSNDGLKIKA